MGRRVPSCSALTALGSLVESQPRSRPKPIASFQRLDRVGRASLSSFQIMWNTTLIPLQLGNDTCTDGK